MNSISILFSGRGTNAESIISNVSNKKLNFKIKRIISSNEDAKGISLLRKYNYPIIVVNKKSFLTTDSYNKAVLETLDPNDNELLLLCGYMLKLPKLIINKYNGNVINIHPSLLPKYKGLNTHKKVILNKDKYHGCSTHFVNDEIDCGPIIAQYKISVEHDDDETSIAEKLLKREHTLYYRTLKMIENQEILLRDNKVLHNGSVLLNPIVFT